MILSTSVGNLFYDTKNEQAVGSPTDLLTVCFLVSIDNLDRLFAIDDHLRNVNLNISFTFDLIFGRYLKKPAAS